jgi:hypothetical protein
VKEEKPISDISRSSAAPHWSPEEGRTSAKIHNLAWFEKEHDMIYPKKGVHPENKTLLNCPKFLQT